jgi:uncharacterized protein (TIGR03067 family)
MRALVLSIAALSLFAIAQTGAAEGGKATSLEGTWVQVEDLANGIKFDKTKSKVKMGLRFKGGRCTRLWNDKPTDELTFTLDEAKSPATMTTTMLSGGKPTKITTVQIYRITSGKLQICRNIGGGTTPKEFTAEKNSNRQLSTYERVP